MKYKKFRELDIDPFNIEFEKININKILNYMPAGNDVIEVLGNDDKKYFIKIERSKVSDFISEYKNIKEINQVYSKVPKVVEYKKYNNKNCLVLEKINGKRLSEINMDLNKREYLLKLGEELSLIHNITIKNFGIAKQRVINEVAKKDLYGEYDNKLDFAFDYLNANNYKKELDCFVHGDFHYGNILWKNKNIVGVLDWEYSGFGHREQDIAWALILRPNQQFFDNVEDIKAFLTGYMKYSDYNRKYLKWCLINGYTHFYLMNKDKTYKNNIIKLIKEIMKI